jgi:hypothetical protein
MIRAAADQAVGAQVLTLASGLPFTGVVTVYVTIDAGVQAIGSVGSGLCTAEGRGYYTYRPSLAETDGALVAFTFTGTGAVTTTIQLPTITLLQQQALQAATAPGAITVANLITRALARINVIQAGETPSAEDMAEGFLILNAWMDGLALERLTMPFLLRTTWTLTSSGGTLTTPYTVGTGGTVNMTRPAMIDHISYQDTNLTIPLERGLDLLTEQAWAALPQKTQTGTLPRYAFYNPTYAGNLGSLYLWPTPSATGLQGVLYAPSPIPRFASVWDTIVLPPGYLRFIRDSIAVEFGATWRENLPVDPQLVKSAADAKRLIQQANLKLTDLSLDPGVLSRGATYDIELGNG